MLGFERAVADADGVRSGDRRVAVDDLDLPLRHRARKVRRNVLDHVFLAIDQRGPIERWPADFDVMDRGALDLVQGMAGGDQYLLRRAAAVRTGAAEVARLDDG